MVGGGINGPSIGDGSINRSRGLTGTGSQSGFINGGGGSVSFGGDFYMFVPGMGCDAACYPSYLVMELSAPATNDQGTFRIKNDGADGNYAVLWRTFLP
jgi:hypothetical protein